MTLSDIIAEVDEARPNHYDRERKTAWINEIESKNVRQVMNRALWDKTEFVPYQYDRDALKELLIPDEHRDVYETYLYAKMDYTSAEMDRYNADAAMHKAAWDDYAAEYRRGHYPYPYETTAFTIEPERREGGGDVSGD